MELSDKVIVLHQDGHAAGTRLANALRYGPSSLKKIEMPLEIPLETYGITDIVVSGQILNFVDSHDYPQACSCCLIYLICPLPANTSLEKSIKNAHYKNFRSQYVDTTMLVPHYKNFHFFMWIQQCEFTQVSLIILQNYKSPTSACVAHEVLSFIRSKTSKLSSSPTVIFPCLTIVRNSSQNLGSLSIQDLDQSLYAAEINEASDFTKAMVKGLKTLPPTAQICDEFLACMLHFAHVLLLPAILLLVPTTRISRSDKGAHIHQAHETQMLCKLGDLLANQTGLTFSKDLLENNAVEIDMDAEDDWRRLYG